MFGPMFYYYCGALWIMGGFALYIALGAEWSYPYTSSQQFWITAPLILIGIAAAYMGRRKARIERDLWLKLNDPDANSS